ncbi:IS5 family transposase, partial [Cryptosporangium japonicum]|uniref:IS5 family transposase n=1 Tax=Cryptosporangium japonicum TaxID=80872 RepID=UPI003CD0934E
VRRDEVSDAAWERIAPLLPVSAGRGGRWKDHRQVLNAIVWKLRTGAPWRDIPERYGSWKTAHERLRRWSADGTWDRILEHVQVHDDAVGEIEWTFHVDSSVVRAHQHAAGARKPGDGEKGGTTRAGVPVAAVAGEAIGRSRGGLSSKIHLAVDGRGRPMAVRLTEGQAGDNPQLLPLLDDVRVPRTGRGRPRKRPDRVVADKAYAHLSTRAALRRRGIAVTIPERSDQVARRAAKGSAGGRPPAFDPVVYRQRNLVERCFNRLKQFRAIATRYAKRAVLYRALLT